MKAATKTARKRKIFVKEYLLDQNGTRAAIAAGYAESGAAVEASRLLKNPKIQEEIANSLTERAKNLDISAEKVLSELAKMGFANMADYIAVDEDGRCAHLDLSKLTRDQAAAIGEIKVEEYTEGRGALAESVRRTTFKLNDKRGSLELLGKHLKLFTDKHEHTLSPLTVDELDEIFNSGAD